MKARQNQIPTPLPQRIAEFRQRWVPVLAWIAAGIVCVLLLGGKGGRYQYFGVAQALSFEVSASESGRLESLLVGLYDEVEAGEVLARLDTSETDARLERSRATVRRLTAELDAERLRILARTSQENSDWANDLRRFQSDEEQRRLKTLELRVAVETGEVEQERRALELSRTAKLLEQGLVGQAEYDNVSLRHDEVAQRNESNKALLSQLEREYRTALDRRGEFERGLPALPEQEATLLPLREAVLIESRRMEEISARREALVLRSPVAGQVSRVQCRQGQSVVPGEPIVTVTEHGVRQIVAFLGESDDRIVQQRSVVRVASTRQPKSVAESHVVRTGPGLERMPERLWRNPSVPDYGRAVIIAATSNLQLTHGERMHIEFTD